MTDIEHIDFEALAELKEVMEDEFSILLETFLHDSKERIDQLLDAISKGDADAYGRAAHSFKGSCTNIGIPYLAKLCFEAETHGKEGNLEGAENLVGRIRAEFAIVADKLGELL